jgi:hypothetical protein
MIDDTYTHTHAQQKSYLLLGKNLLIRFKKIAKQPRRVLRRALIRGDRAYVIIASPRSASNTLKAICEDQSTPPLKVISPKTESGFGHFSVDEGKFPIFGNFIWYQHLWPTNRNMVLVHRLTRSTPIVTWRNAFDWVVSVAEWLPRVGRAPWGIETDGIIARECVAAAPNELARAFEYVIQYELPMYIRFLNGWQEFSKRHRKIKFLSYSEIVDEDASHLRKTLREAGFFMSRQCVAQEHLTTNLNVGTAGRGKELMSQAQIKKIEGMCRSLSIGWVLGE